MALLQLEQREEGVGQGEADELRRKGNANKRRSRREKGPTGGLTHNALPMLGDE